MAPPIKTNGFDNVFSKPVVAPSMFFIIPAPLCKTEPRPFPIELKPEPNPLPIPSKVLPKPFPNLLNHLKNLLAI